MRIEGSGNIIKEMPDFQANANARITCIVENKQGSRFINGIETFHNKSAEELVNDIQ